MAKITTISLEMRQARTFKGLKSGGVKKGFYFGIDPIPEEIQDSVHIVDEGEFIQVEACVESGSIKIPRGKFVAYEVDERCPHGYNCWEKSNAATTIIRGKDDEGNDCYIAKGEEVEVCITSNGALPWFLTDDKAPQLRILGNEFEILGCNDIWQRGTVGNSFFVYYNREVNGKHDVAIVDADTLSAKQYYAIIEQANAENVTVIYLPLLHFLGSVA